MHGRLSRLKVSQYREVLNKKANLNDAMLIIGICVFCVSILLYVQRGSAMVQRLQMGALFTPLFGLNNTDERPIWRSDRLLRHNNSGRRTNTKTRRRRKSVPDPLEEDQKKGEDGRYTKCRYEVLNITSNNVLLYNVLCKGPQVAHDVVSFTGPRTKQLFDSKNSKPHISLGNKIKAKTWGGVSALINDTHQMPYPSISPALRAMQLNHTTVSIHLHNEMQLGDLLLLVVQEYAKQHSPKGRITRDMLVDNYLHLNRSK